MNMEDVKQLMKEVGRGRFRRWGRKLVCVEEEQMGLLSRNSVASLSRNLSWGNAQECWTSGCSRQLIAAVDASS